ncbi:catalase [Tersicoccus solisilvae]|uniref:Catalase n=1 Tax=Tersicoccus solisilvae TaxID=1882339 RepID=A0ABQ1NYG7_9MICC|nr:catalase [Tersicoccus solisilvae]GGC86672.1 catalase [Tersicoccus solisilvae]
MTTTPRETGSYTTANNGAPVASDNESLTVGADGPVVLHDHYLVEKLAQFNRERVPERVVHAKGGGAFGVFTTTEDVSPYTRAALFQPNTTTEMVARFSTVAGEQGSPDTWRDPRGFALKFYTSEGNYDLVGNNTPVFFIKDGIKFPDFIHSQKRLPGSALRDNDMQWDFWSLRPESSHQVTWLMGDRGIPKTWRHMDGFGSHTYQWINAAGERFWVKYHFQTNQGNEYLTPEEAERLAGVDADAHRRDLFDAIERGEFPSWTLYVQVMPYEDAKTYRFNPFDLTKVWPHGDYPLIKVGTMTLNRNPQNFHAQIEQLALEPSNFVPGIATSPDKMLLARIFSYADAHRYRIGANYQDLPVNYPKNAQVNSYSKEGPMRYTFNDPQVPVYAPNSFGGPHAAPERAAESNGWDADGELVRAAATLHPEDDDVTQPRNLYRHVLDAQAQERLVHNIAGHIAGVRSADIRERAFQYWENIDPELGSRVRHAYAEAQAEQDQPVATV